MLQFFIGVLTGLRLIVQICVTDSIDWSGDVIFNTALSMSESIGLVGEIIKSAESDALRSDTSDTSREVVLSKKSIHCLHNSPIYDECETQSVNVRRFK